LSSRAPSWRTQVIQNKTGCPVYASEFFRGVLGAAIAARRGAQDYHGAQCRRDRRFQNVFIMDASFHKSSLRLSFFGAHSKRRWNRR